MNTQSYNKLTIKMFSIILLNLFSLLNISTISVKMNSHRLQYCALQSLVNFRWKISIWIISKDWYVLMHCYRNGILIESFLFFYIKCLNIFYRFQIYRMTNRALVMTCSSYQWNWSKISTKYRKSLLRFSSFCLAFMKLAVCIQNCKNFRKTIYFVSIWWYSINK